MIDIPMKCKSAVNRTTLHTLNKKQNERQPQTEESALISSVLKGQKISLGSSLTGITARLGWKTKNTRCDINVSAFLLGADGKVPGDDWFVFYGQTRSPDQSTVFCAGQAEGSESVTVDFRRLHPSVKKIVFVLTIYEALEHKLHFGMVSDAWIRILNSNDNTELVCFKMTDYYSNVTSMMIGEIYCHNGTWKFNAVGNGVAKDLAGLCTLYGVQVTD